MPQGADCQRSPWCCGCVSGNRLCLKKQGPRAGAGLRGPSTSRESRIHGRGVPVLWAFQSDTRLVNKAPSPRLSLSLQVATSLMGTGGTHKVHTLCRCLPPCQDQYRSGGRGRGQSQVAGLGTNAGS